jgi:transcriptional regulator GlxA family with amidase domain
VVQAASASYGAVVKYWRVMERERPVIAFVVASPFEILDLTGPVSVFERCTTNGEPHYSIRILSTRSDGAVKTEGGMVISDTCKYSDYLGPIDTLIVSGGVGVVAPQPPEVTVISEN